MPNATETSSLMEYSVSPVLKTAGSLLLILALLMLALFLLKRYGPRFNIGGKASQDGPRLESRLSLGPKHQVAVVVFRKKTLLLGVTDHAINVLTSLDENEGERPKDQHDKDFQSVLDQTGPGRAAD